MTRKIGRRDFGRGVGALMVTGVLAGCSDGSDTDNGGDDDTPTDGGSSAPAEVDEYLDGAKLYDGTLVDETGSSSVEVDVGGGSGGLAFDPPAIEVSSGTTVTWTWTGEGGTHNAVAEDGSFESGDPVSDGGTTFEHTFEEAGIFNYYCSPHKAIGMKGSIVVE